MARGGYQRPTQPAPASGPGALSRRTDGGPVQKLRDLPDAQYGEAATFRDLQQEAPLAQTPSGGATQAPTGGGPAMPSVNFGGPTERPDEPGTTGNAFGPGAGPEALQGGDPNQADLARLRPMLPALEVLASLPTTSPQTRNLIRYIRGAS